MSLNAMTPSFSNTMSAGISRATMRLKIDGLGDMAQLRCRCRDAACTDGGRHQRPSRAFSTASAAGPAVEVRSTSSPRRTAHRAGRLEQRRARAARSRPPGPTTSSDRARQRPRSTVGRARGRRGLEHEHRAPSARRGRAASSSRASDTSGTHGRIDCLRRLAHDRRPAVTALGDLGALPPRDAALGRPRDDPVDPELGRRLHGELVAIALRERLREDRRRRRGRGIVVDVATSTHELGRARRHARSPSTTSPRAVADRDALADADPAHRDRVPRLVTA